MKHLLAFIVLITSSLNSSATILTFDGLATSSGGNTLSFTDITVDGFDLSLDPTYGYMIGTDYTDDDARINAFNGTDMAIFGPNDGALEISVSSSSGDAFSLTQFDATEFFDATNTSLSISATLFGGGSVTENFTTDDIVNDERGSHNDFQTFTLSSAFSSVTSVTFNISPNIWFALDNIYLNESPTNVGEPSALLLLCLGLFGLNRARRRTA